MVRIVARNSQMELLESGWFQSPIGEPIDIKIDLLTTSFRYQTSTEPPSLDFKMDEENLLLIFNLKGNLPGPPFAFGTTQPGEVGKIGDERIYLSWNVRRSRPDSEYWEIDYSVYKGVAKPAVTQNDGGEK